MRTMTYLNASELTRHYLAELYADDKEYFRTLRQYNKFRAHLLQKIERLERIELAYRDTLPLLQSEAKSVGQSTVTSSEIGGIYLVEP